MIRSSSVLAFAFFVMAVAACDKAKPVDAPSAGSSALTASSGSAPTTEAPTPASQTTTTTTPSTVNMPTLSADKTKALATGSNAFAFDLWRRTKKEKGNFAFSPASISMAFAMTYGGAKGETASQIKKVFHFDEEPSALMTSWGALSRALTDSARPIKLRIANRLFGEETYKFEKTYLDQTKNAFGAPLETLDFKTAPEPARQRINAWVEEQTEKRIRDLLPPDSIKSLTRMVLANAIYFLGDWEQQFDAKVTRDETFHTSATATKKVPTMRQTKHFAVGQVGGARVLELPYKGGAASLLVVMPDQVDGLSALEGTISSASLDGWRKALAEQNVDVSLPRFELKPPSLPLGSELSALGMPLAFDKAKADFTGIGNPSDPAERLAIDEAFHKAFVKVDEKGTEAAAATAVVMGARGLPERPMEFKVDRPFLFFVIEKPSDLVLFMGRVTEP
jgi:serpin B